MDLEKLFEQKRIEKGSTNYFINTEDKQSGIYYIRMINETGSSKIPIIIKN